MRYIIKQIDIFQVQRRFACRKRKWLESAGHFSRSTAGMPTAPRVGERRSTGMVEDPESESFSDNDVTEVMEPRAFHWKNSLLGQL